MRCGVQSVDRKARAYRAHPVERSECRDARARRGMHEARTVRDGAQYLAKSLELRPVVRWVGIVRGCEVGKDSIDLDVGHRRDRAIPRRSLGYGRAQSGEAGVDLEVDARCP